MLVLVRHGQTDANAQRRLQGRVDLPLTEVGREQAAALARALPSVAAVVSSPLARARATAAAFGLPVEVDERWVEADYGVYDGRPIDDVPADDWARWRHDVTFAPPGGESTADVGRRVRAACVELEPRARDEDIVVVSHVSPIKAAVAWALGVDDDIVWRMFLDLASITRVAVTDRGPLLRSFNEPARA